ncbi:unnamed protein product [Rhodiola kirilowii]
MVGEVSDVSTKEMVCSAAKPLTGADMAENMSITSNAPPISEDLLTTGSSLSAATMTADETPNGKCDQSSQHPDGIINEEVKLDAECTEGNHGVEEVVTINDEKTVPSSLAPENPLGDDILIEAHHDSPSEPATGVEVVVADNQESLDHNVIDNSPESSLLACANIVRQSSSDLSGQKVADKSDGLSPAEANTVMDGVDTQEIAALCEPNVVTGVDAVVADEMNKETPLKGNKQDELPVLSDGDRSTGCEEPLCSSHACTGTSDKDIQHAVVKQSDSNLNSTEADYLAIDKESKNLQEPQVPSTSKKDDSFSFDLPITSDGNTGKVWQPFSTPQAVAICGTVVDSPVASTLTPKNKKRSHKISEGVKESSEPKRRRSTARKSGKKGNQPDEATLLKQLGSEERPANSQTPNVSSLPTLSFSTSLPTAFQQPFTDLQQLQLRAQIFVYGSLIQGNAPDEACLISAFGGPDGGRSIWEKPWRRCLDRIHNQISQTNMRSPVLQTSDLITGKSTPDQTSKRKRNVSPLGSAGKSDSSHTVNPMIPLSSPLWNMHTSAPDGLPVTGVPQAPIVDHNPLPPLYPLQTPTKNIGHSTSWSSHASVLLPRVASPQTSPWDPNMSSALPIVEPVKLMPVKGSSLIPYSAANHPSADLSLPIVAASAISSDMVGANPVLKPIGQTTKSKKQKKVFVSDDCRQVLEPASQSSERVLANPSNSIQLVPVQAALLSAANMASSATPLLSSDCPLVGNKGADRKDKPSEDTLHQVNNAKLHAEEASACAEAAVSHSQHVWGQLDKQKNSGLTVDRESKVASAAVAIAAAASVAKAAAAAAKLAFEAALQAKLMFEESSVFSECVKAGSVTGVALSDGANLLSEVTPASILKGENRANHSISMISAAKEAARRKIESALAASKHAENVDAIVKAAELAAEAVAQASRVVAMGDPLPLSELAESRPEDYHKHSQGPQEQRVISNSVKGVSCINEANDGNVSSYKMSQDGGLESEPSQLTKSGKSENPPTPEIASLETGEAQMTTVSLVSASNINDNLNENVVVPPEFACEKESPSLSSRQESGKTVETSADNHIKEGSIVEVFKEWGTVKAAWFAARVLELKDEEICVKYQENQFSDGKHKEWITLSCEDNSAPIVRIAHPMTVVPSDGARKRQRSAIGNCSWQVGDKVDALMQDCWWEGIIIEKNSKDESSLTVQFPAQGETCVVKAWNLRPSLIWKDRAWVQWSNPNENLRSHHENDTPRGKRQKLSNPEIDVKGKGKASESSSNVSLRVHDQSGLVGLSEHEKKFNVGKNIRDDVKVNAQRMVRTGLREGSKVIFGVPKHGKKMKFMDVSNSSKPLKPPRLPISRGPYGWKNSNSRTEPQQKTSKPKPKDASVLSAASQIDEDKEMDYTAGSVSAKTERQAEPESCSDADGTIDDSILISSLARPSVDPFSKRSALGKMKSERATKVKLGLTHAKMAGVEGDKVFSRTKQQEALDGSEPRRSNRRIQPTSRLLEGLQTSLSIAKVSSTANRK